MDKIEELEKQLADAKREAEADAIAEAKAIKRENEYRIDWSTDHYNLNRSDLDHSIRRRGEKDASKYIFRCHRRPTRETIAAIEAWKAKYPKVHYSFWCEDRWEGFTYILVQTIEGDYLLMNGGGGGTLVLNATDDSDSFSNEPKRITKEQYVMLSECIVPHELKS